MNPPKCKTCGVAEWNHTCVPAYIAWQKAAGIEGEPPKPLTSQAVRQIISKISTDGIPPIKIKIDRKEYLKLKARERRAKIKAKK